MCNISENSMCKIDMITSYMCRPFQRYYSYGQKAYWPALAVGSAAQLAATRCPNERTWSLYPQSSARQTHLRPSELHYVWLQHAMFPGNDLLFSVASITDIELTT